MDQLSDLLRNIKPTEPPQIQAMKDYVRNHHNVSVKIAVTNLGYSMTVPTGIIASQLQMEIPKIQQECDLDKKLFIRIGHA